MPGPENIAIVGMAGMFAAAPDVDTYWANILGKVDAVRDAPPGWICDESIFDTEADRDSLQIYTRRGGFLGDIARFDPRPFGTMPVAVSGAEPDQFLALQCAVRALADAGYSGRNYPGENTGIILGHGIHANRGNVNGVQHGIVLNQTIAMLRAVFPELDDAKCRAIEAMLSAKLPTVNVDTVPGLVPNMMTGRIANRLDLMGPNYILDAACASSTLAVEAAMTELRTGRADMMLAGGINTSTSPLVYMVFCKLGALSRNSRIRPFDRGADGTLLGEGQGMVVLKRLADAQRDGNHIYAVIKGSGASSDGRAMGLMAPRLEGEILAMRRAYESSGIDPATIELVETHGTGIPLGDELEVHALTAVMGERRRPIPDIAIGSVKSMIGHCIPAAGMASLIKMAMALDQKILPPTLADEPNPALGLDKTPFYLNTEARPWLHRKDAPRRAAINAFGFGGINTHMILEEAPDAPAPAAFGLRQPRPSELFVLAAHSRDGLIAAASALSAQAAGALTLRQLAAETGKTLASGGQRLAVVAADTAALRRKLATAIEKLGRADLHRLRDRSGIFFADEPIGGKVAFLFPGENSQYANMLRDLALASPIVRDWFDRLEGLFHGERDIAHRLMLFPPPLGLSEAQRSELEERLRRVDNGSEAVFFADQAIFTLLRTLGVQPDFVVGHSTGENAAVIAAGLIRATADEVDENIRRMNVIFQRVETDRLVPNGTLLAVGAIGRPVIEQILAKHAEIHLTMDNCPNQVILFGPAPLMSEVGAALTGQGAICTILPLAWAYHTPFVTPMADAFIGLVEDDYVEATVARVYSCASAGPFPDDVADIRSLMHAQYTSRVRFTDTILRLHEDGARIFVEVGPSGNLTGFVGDILRGKPHLALASDSTRGSSLEQMLLLLGQLYVHRVPLDLTPLFAGSTIPAKPRGPEPVLESALPYIRLAPEEALQLREMLVGGLPAIAAEQVPTPPSAPRATPSMLSEHFQLMNHFLTTQEQVTRQLLQKPAQGAEPLPRRATAPVK